MDNLAKIRECLAKEDYQSLGEILYNNHLDEIEKLYLEGHIQDVKKFQWNSFFTVDEDSSVWVQDEYHTFNMDGTLPNGWKYETDYLDRISASFKVPRYVSFRHPWGFVSDAQTQIYTNDPNDVVRLDFAGKDYDVHISWDVHFHRSSSIYSVIIKYEPLQSDTKQMARPYLFNLNK